jgi:hypothetical protein
VRKGMQCVVCLQIEGVGTVSTNIFILTDIGFSRINFLHGISVMKRNQSVTIVLTS